MAALGIGDHGLAAETDLRLIARGVDLGDHDLELFAHLDVIARVPDSIVGDLADVDQAVDSAEIGEDPVGLDAGDHDGLALAGLEGGEDRLAVLGPLLFDDRLGG